MLLPINNIFVLPLDYILWFVYLIVILSEFNKHNATIAGADVVTWESRNFDIVNSNVLFV